MSAPAPHHPHGGFSLPSFGLAPAAPLQVHAPLSPTQTVEISLPLSTAGSVMKTEPLNSLQVRPREDQAPWSLPTCPGEDQGSPWGLAGSVTVLCLWSLVLGHRRVGMGRPGAG